MEIKINIEKRYAFAIIGVVVLFFGVFFVMGQMSATPNPGHDVNQIYGAAPNCGTGSPISNQIACNVNLRSIVGSNLDQGVGYAGRAAVSDNAGLLDNIDSSGFCQTGGAGCPAIPTIPSNLVYSIPSTQSSCPAGSPLICVINTGSPGNGFNTFEPYWSSGRWRNSNGYDCTKVICG